jgi:hypothetical protein
MWLGDCKPSHDAVEAPLRRGFCFSGCLKKMIWTFAPLDAVSAACAEMSFMDLSGVLTRLVRRPPFAAALAYPFDPPIAKSLICR